MVREFILPTWIIRDTYIYIYTLYIYTKIMIHIIGGMFTIPKWVVYDIVLPTLL